MRQAPDVASVADPDSGFLVVFGGRPRVKGGTSAAAPLWAGLTALIAQAAEREGIGPLGFLAPLLYEAARREPSAFFDVVRGGNRLHNAGPGWDYATGLGTPRADVLARTVIGLLRGG
jgi:kumamolisin